MLSEALIRQKRRLPPNFDLARHMAKLDERGLTIIEDFLDADQVAQFERSLAQWLGTYRGRNPFEGLTTERVYTLVGRGAIHEHIASEPRLLALLDGLLMPDYLLSANHAICIYPGEKEQGLHTDDGFYPFPRPRPAISISTIGAIDAFTPENGGTRMIPGSHKWDAAKMRSVVEASRRGETTPETESMIRLTMPAGAICVFHGTLVHGAGANDTNARRLSYTNHYCEPWARPQENFYLGVPRERVQQMSPEMKSLLGYELRNPGSIMGQVGGYHPGKTLDPDFVLPVLR
ncbi:MAG TPA: phytanoyl-CoA dioxygenase family protein [Caulobacteraceae bacterium]|jgi:ectoine hydroxylase-related dioxygenase (phytanoyl-CoA dioxygenase family)